MEQPCLGRLATESDERDAIHIAIVPVIAGERLYPGEQVVIRNGEAFRSEEKPIGVVDPFLRLPVRRGERFFLCLYPGTITGMRHHWKHPQFDESLATMTEKPDEESVEHNPRQELSRITMTKAEAEAVLRSFSREANQDFDHVVDVMTSFNDMGEVWVEHGSVSSRDAYYDTDKTRLWKAWSVWTGIPISEVPEDAPFGCSC